MASIGHGARLKFKFADSATNKCLLLEDLMPIFSLKKTGYQITSNYDFHNVMTGLLDFFLGLSHANLKTSCLGFSSLQLLCPKQRQDCLLPAISMYNCVDYTKNLFTFMSVNIM